MKSNGYKMIAIGIVLTYETRKKKIAIMNAEIDSCVDSIRSSSDLDGMPHGSSVGDPVGQRLEKQERIEKQRDLEQMLVSSVDWAYSYVRDMFSEHDAEYICKAIGMNINGNKDGAMKLLRENTDVPPSTFYRARSTFLKQIINFLHLG